MRISIYELNPGSEGRAIDLDGYRRAIENVINVGDFVDYRAMYDYSRGIEEVIDSIESLNDAHPAEVIELCEHALGCLEEATGYVDDSDGSMGSIRDRLCDLHHSACLIVRPDPEKLAQRLFEWEMQSDWETFLGAAATYADVLGEEGLATYHRLAERRWRNVPRVGPGEVRERSAFRFRITYAMETLARVSRDVDALVAVKSADLSHAYGYVQIAQVYQEAGRYAGALSWAEQGLAPFPERTDVRLREVLAEEYQRGGRHDDAIALIWAELIERPTLSSYQRLKTHAERAEQWDGWRAKALDFMGAETVRASGASPTPGRWGPAADRSELVRVHLWEGDINAAWAEAVAGGCSHSLWMELASLRERDHPADALPIYQEAVERTVGAKNNHAYAEAVELAHKVQQLMGRLGRDDEFASYLQSLRSAHKPKRNFMKLLDQAGW